MAIAVDTVRAELIDAPREITTWALFAVPTGAAVVDVRKAVDVDAYNAGTYSSICGGSKPTLGGTLALEQGDALGVWDDVSLVKGNVLVYVVESCDTAIEWLAPRLLTRRT